ncbi:NYN domain-containing protein [Tritonibacter mobilis]|uniref:Maebl n=1 Tax=Tritonibacter mobilis F1926 TaxID=1265309 RepID=A0A1B1A3E3_9RHOB|nr:NYN domain-containing protein [Tritonibacter mobilis]NKX36478.1 NYN domain-containing protein [Rhodobacteraceae bacterium R_SAG4]NKX38158.1 NYN domain-containing protein [Rhodobacteraceae bacterium R_SAG5]NKX73722.1 NYN domain-containing protein [Rhodobacteraceae bacterium R_SAG3]ANP41110.1 Maebl [Tritonibacter mobilis F1926]KJZ22970.1 Maebl [Tritonibacter mobilis]
MANSEKPPLLAVLIDADNISAKHAEVMFEEIASLGEASIRRIYGDFSGGGPQGWSKDKLAAYAIVPHQQFANTTGKNASDIALVIDAMDILHSGRFDGFVLISSDSDFTRLASRIREQGLDVYGMGMRKTPAAFVRACKRFIYVENLLNEVPKPQKPKPKPANHATGEAPEQAVMAQDDQAPAELEDPQKLVLRAMDAISQEDEWFSLGQIGQYITAASPDFDTRSYGKRKLSDLIATMKILETRRGEGNQILVRRLD